MSSLTSLNLTNVNTSSVTNMSQMFFQLNVTSLDVSSFDTSFRFLCTISGQNGDKNCTLNYIAGEYYMKNSTILIDNTLHEITVNTSFIDSHPQLPNYCMSNVYSAIAPFGYGPMPLTTGSLPISIPVTNDCCYVIPYIMELADAN